MSSKTESKVCAACGREFRWRRKWKQCWDRVRYCSQRCRTTRIARLDRELEDAVRQLLRARAGTICPSEAARRVAPESWRSLLQRTRSAGRRMALRDEIVVLQRGRPVDARSASGAIRFGRGRRFPPG